MTVGFCPIAVISRPMLATIFDVEPVIGSVSIPVVLIVLPIGPVVARMLPKIAGAVMLAVSPAELVRSMSPRGPGW